jgi:hypothetical protein
MVYIYFGKGVLCWKNNFLLFFLGFCFVHLLKDLFLWLFFFLLSWDHRLFHFGFFPIFLSFFFSFIFSSTSKRHFSPFFSSSLLLLESLVFPLFHIILLTECFLSFFCRISWFYLFIYFYLFV